MPLLVSILTFAVVALAFLFVWMFFEKGNTQEMVRRRLEAVQKTEQRGEQSLAIDLLRDEMLSGVPAIHRVLLHWAWPSRLRDFLSQAGLEMKPAKLLTISGFVAVFSALIVSIFLPHLSVVLLIGILAGFTPMGIVAFMRQRRLRAFEERFPEALDLLGRAVRAGHAFTTGLEMIAKESAEPIAGEFRTAFDEQNFGLPLRDALMNLTDRVPLIDVRFFVTALLIQKETGGNLAEILDSLAHVIRDRFRIYREVRTRTAQGRLTAGILIALPPLMMVALSVLNPGYVGVLFTDPKGVTFLTIAGVLQVVGSAILWKIIHIEV
ncbi:MAG TPA: type II secretion system F family protein [Candidatus Acidoferrales bacterium]|nr:type II secretion system F family protein [Candidatus Acidoferrales bacterium]